MSEEEKQIDALNRLAAAVARWNYEVDNCTGLEGYYLSVVDSIEEELVDLGIPTEFISFISDLIIAENENPCLYEHTDDGLYQVYKDDTRFKIL